MFKTIWKVLTGQPLVEPKDLLTSLFEKEYDDVKRPLTEKEEEVQAEVLKAIDVLCAEFDLEIPSEEQHPLIRYDRSVAGSWYKPSQNLIGLNTDSPCTIYEETTHYLHHLNKPESDGDTLNWFFHKAIEEAIGYYGSLFSDEERKFTIAEIEADVKKSQETLEELAAQKPNKKDKLKHAIDEYVHAEASARLAYAVDKSREFLSVVATYASGEKDEELEWLRTADDDALWERFKEKVGRKTFNREFFEKNKNLTLVLCFPDDLRSIYNTIMALISNDMFRCASATWHAIGYQLGDQLYTMRAKNPENAQRVMKELIRAPEDKSFVAFVDAYREANRSN